MKEIVEKTGLSKGAFYHYFNSKEQVFEEVIKYFFADFMNMDLSRLSHNSLLEFYNDMLKEMDRKMKAATVRLALEQEGFSANHYFILFDAIKMLPSFKAELAQMQKEEVKGWGRIIQKARSIGEIKSELTDEQLAEMFICIGDGIGINLILEEKADRTRKKVTLLWNALYNMIKA